MRISVTYIVKNYSMGRVVDRTEAATLGEARAAAERMPAKAQGQGGRKARAVGIDRIVTVQR